LNSGSPPSYANGRVTFELDLAPAATWHTCCHYLLDRGEAVLAPRRGCQHDGVASEDALQARWRSGATKVTSANEDVYRVYRRRHAALRDCAARGVALARRRHAAPRAPRDGAPLPRVDRPVGRPRRGRLPGVPDALAAGLREHGLEGCERRGRLPRRPPGAG